MKTPLNELIKQMSYNRDRALGAEKDAYNICILYAENMLEKEKEVMVDFAYKCRNVMAADEFAITHWYHKTFKTKER